MVQRIIDVDDNKFGTMRGGCALSRLDAFGYPIRPVLPHIQSSDLCGRDLQSDVHNSCAPFLDSVGRLSAHSLGRRSTWDVEVSSKDPDVVPTAGLTLKDSVFVGRFDEDLWTRCL